MKKVLLLLLTIIIFNGCKHCDKQKELPSNSFTSSDKLFFPYSVNDTLKFKSKLDSVKFIVSTLSINWVKQFGNCQGECCQNYYQDEKMTLIIQNIKNQYEEFSCSIGHDEINKSPAMLHAEIIYYYNNSAQSSNILSFYLKDTLNDNYSVYNEQFYTWLDSINYNGKSYYKVSVLKCTKDVTNTNLIDTLFYNKSNGFIGYTRNGSRYFKK